MILLVHVKARETASLSSAAGHRLYRSGAPTQDFCQAVSRTGGATVQFVVGTILSWGTQFQVTFVLEWAGLLLPTAMRVEHATER